MLLDNEMYLCHLTSNELDFSTVAVGSGTSYVCNITDSIMFTQSQLELITGWLCALWRWTSIHLLPCAVFDVSFVSSLQGITFSTEVRALTVYQCNATRRYIMCE